MNLSTKSSLTPSGIKTCKHCGNPLDEATAPEAAERGFCCSGCEYVYRLIHGQKLDRFYELRGRTVDPVGGYVFRPRDTRWLKGLALEAEKKAKDRAVLTLRVQGISCVGCVWLIEKVFLDREGARLARVNATEGTVRLEWVPGQLDVPAFALDLQRFGYLLGPAGGATRGESSRLTMRLGMCAAFAMNAMLFTLPVYLGMTPDFWFAWLFSALAFAFSTMALIVGGSYFFRRSLTGLRHGVIHIDLPISLGLIFAYAGSLYGWITGTEGMVYFDFVATFSFLMLVGRWTQQVAVERNQRRLLDATMGLPRVERVGGSGEAGTEEVSVEDLGPGDIYRLEPGQAVPVCSQLRVSDASFGLDWISGESEARASRVGQLVSAGAINLSPTAIEMQAVEVWDQSLLSRLLAGGESGERGDPLLERIIRIYLIAVLALAAAGGGAWFVLAGDSGLALRVAVSVLVVSCPCALGVSLPLLDEMATARMRRFGVYVRAEHVWQRLRRVTRVVFDKTGTLTLESPILLNRAELGRLDSADREALGAMVRESRHPVASCLREALLADGWIDGRSQVRGDLEEEVGQGLIWRDGEHEWRLGRPSWAVFGNTGSPVPAGDEVRTVYSRDGRALIGFIIRDEVRPGARSEVAALLAMGYEIRVLSGDRRSSVESMVRGLGLPETHGLAEQSPQEKADWVRNHDARRILMIGDGANDSLAFDAAGCRGTPAIDRGLLEQKSDFFFLGRSLSGIRRLMETARRHGRVASAILVFAILYNLVAVAFCLAGRMNPLLAAVLMPLSALVSLAIAAWGMSRQDSANTMIVSD
ncbi:MAG: heavy metal translocating P-type ATPase metal-binding domain-containing protein [Opitutaceae bacterium]